MPKATSPEDIARIQALVASGKSTRAIAEQLGLGKSSVARYAKSVVATTETSAPPIENVSMPIDDNTARAFLSDIGIKGPASSLRNEIVPASNPLKNNPRAIQLAESLLGTRQEPGIRFQKTEIVPHIEVTEIESKPEKPTLITQIQLNLENFAPLLKNITNDDPETFKQSLYMKSDSELMTLLKVIERTRLVGNMTNQMKHMFWMSTSAVEMATQMIGLKSQGLTEALRLQDEEIKMVLKELAMERADAFAGAQRPEMRLAFLVSTTLLSVDAMNRARELRKPKTGPDKNEKFSDL